MKKLFSVLLVCILITGFCNATTRFAGINSEIKTIAIRNYPKTLLGKRIAVTFIDLKTGYKCSVNGDKPFPAASIIKIPVMAALFDSIQKKKAFLSEKIYCSEKDKLPEAGQLQWLPAQYYTIKNLCSRMISQSDNTATRLIVRRLSKARINAYIRRIGLRNTIVRDETALSEMPNGNVNLATTNDIARILQRIELSKGFTKASRREMLSYMFAQKYVFGIPRALPPSFRCANKTGMHTYVLHDTAIVYSRRGNYVLCVFTKGFVSDKKAASVIRDVSKTVAAYYM